MIIRIEFASESLNERNNKTKYNCLHNIYLKRKINAFLLKKIMIRIMVKADIGKPFLLLYCSKTIYFMKLILKQ